MRCPCIVLIRPFPTDGDLTIPIFPNRSGAARALKESTSVLLREVEQLETKLDAKSAALQTELARLDVSCSQLTAEVGELREKQAGLPERADKVFITPAAAAAGVGRVRGLTRVLRSVESGRVGWAGRFQGADSEEHPQWPDSAECSRIQPRQIDTHFTPIICLRTSRLRNRQQSSENRAGRADGLHKGDRGGG